MDAATSALDTAEAQLRQAANAVGYATLKADAAGIVTSVTAEPGQVVSAGATCHHARRRRRDRNRHRRSRSRRPAGCRSGQDAKVDLWAGPRDSIEGRIREIAGQADAASRTYAVRIAVNRPPPSMRLGMTASVAITVDDEAAPIVVPLTAVTEVDGGPVVFVVDPESKVVRKTPSVALGRADRETASGLRAGLQAGDMVVIAGVQFLRDGMRVRFPGEYQLARAPSRAESGLTARCISSQAINASERCCHVRR